MVEYTLEARDFKRFMMESFCFSNNKSDDKNQHTIQLKLKELKTESKRIKNLSKVSKQQYSEELVAKECSDIEEVLPEKIEKRNKITEYLQLLKQWKPKQQYSKELKIQLISELEDELSSTKERISELENFRDEITKDPSICLNIRIADIENEISLLESELYRAKRYKERKKDFMADWKQL